MLFIKDFFLGRKVQLLQSVKTFVTAKDAVLDIVVGHRPKSEHFYTTAGKLRH